MKKTLLISVTLMTFMGSAHAQVRLELHQELNCNSNAIDSSCIPVLNLVNVGDTVKVLRSTINNNPKCGGEINQILKMGDSILLVAPAVLAVMELLYNGPKCGNKIVKVDVETDHGTVTFK